MDANGWEFVVEGAFDVSGKGTGVVGRLVGVFDSAGKPANLFVGQIVRRVDRVYLEFMREHGSEGRALMLYGVSADQVPTGSVIKGPTE